MDRQAWIAVTLCVLGLIGWQYYMATHMPAPAPQQVATSPTPELATATPSPAPAAVPAGPGAEPAAATPVEATPEFEEKTEALRNADVELRLTNRGGGIREADLLNHRAANGTGHVVLNAGDHLPIGAFIEQPNTPTLPEFQMARQADGAVQFERTTPQGVTIRKRFTLPQNAKPEDTFVAEMQVEFRNDGAQPHIHPPYFVALGAAAPMHASDITAYTRLVWLMNGDPKSIDVNWFPPQHYPIVGTEKRGAQPFYREPANGADWAGVSTQFFTTLITPLSAKAVEVWARPFDVNAPPGQKLLGIEGAMGMPGFQVQPGQTHTLRFQIYSGPKLYGRLAKLEHQEAEIMNFSNFTLLKIISEALLNFMNLLHGWVRDYGVAIVLLTVCVKAVLWPLQNRANRSMQRMAVLSPRIQELRDKYKDDPTRMNQEVMKLYKEQGVNPVGGCLPMMIQIPIFFGLFNMLGQVAELRNATFLWVDDLSQPDEIFRIPGIDFPVNLLPLLMGASNVWLMQMTPKTGDPMQRRVLMFMPIIFLVFCYNFAAALALYYTTQNLLTILQLWVNKRQPLPVLATAPPAVPTKKSRKGQRR
ncbi:MAG TPA: membrane protein insertase YidC [Chthoniobacterales bacterium]|nr:membrane protein insertase YidC [Chthoniobacterales bacterium]